MFVDAGHVHKISDLGLGETHISRHELDPTQLIGTLSLMVLGHRIWQESHRDRTAHAPATRRFRRVSGVAECGAVLTTARGYA